jgi:hypothetical protein
MVPEAALHVQGIQAQRARLGDVQRRVLERLSSTAHFDLAEFGVKHFVLTPALALQADALDLQELLADPEVAEVIEDRVVRPTLAQSVPLIGADSSGTFLGRTGQGQVVAILDTGVDKNHSFLSGKVVSEACYSSNVPADSATSLCPGGVPESTANNSGLNCAPSISGCDHGTHVAGIAAGSGGSFSGVARNAQLIAIQVFTLFDGVDLGAYASDIIKGLERVYALRTTFNIAAANLSLGGGRTFSPCDSEPEKPVIDNLRAARIATVIASGNDGWTDSIGYPACISTAVSVGSTTKQDVVSWFSNSADFLDLLAPGSGINSSVPGNAFASFDGTSMATPHVAGAWAVLKEAAPNAGVAELLDALKETGVPVTDTRAGANNRVKPRIQVDAALVGGPDPQAPGKPDTLVPSGVIQTARPTYQWNAVTAADPVSSYRLYVTDGTAAGVVDQEYSAAAAGCAGGGTCAVTPAVDLANTAATWKVRAKNSFGFGSWSDPPRSFQVTKGLANGVSMTGLSGTENSEHYFHLQVPAGATNLQVVMSGGTGDADLYVRFGALPTLDDWDCRPWLDGNNETCPFPTPTAGAYYVMLHGFFEYSGVTLVASYTGGTDPCPELVLQNRTVTGTETHAECRITAGPAFVVTATGNATFRAGERITLRPGFQVRAGGRFQARMVPSLKP